MSRLSLLIHVPSAWPTSTRALNARAASWLVKVWETGFPDSSQRTCQRLPLPQRAPGRRLVGEVLSGLGLVQRSRMLAIG